MKEDPVKFICCRELWFLLLCSQRSLRIKTRTDDVKYLKRKQLVLENQAKN